MPKKTDDTFPIEGNRLRNNPYSIVFEMITGISWEKIVPDDAEMAGTLISRYINDSIGFYSSNRYTSFT